jgi:hypothetical protein
VNEAPAHFGHTKDMDVTFKLLEKTIDSDLKFQV